MTFEWALTQMKAGKIVAREHVGPHNRPQSFRIGGPNLCFFEDDLLDESWVEVAEEFGVCDVPDAAKKHK